MSQINNYYEFLKLKSDASASEIVAAYHAAKIAILQIEKEETRTAYLSSLEKAYSTLSDPSQRQKYNDLLSWSSSPAPKVPEAGPLHGPELAKIRNQNNLTREEVFRITRIPLKYLQAIEEEIWEEMPARVYVQGFVKNLAQAYKLSPDETVKRYLEHFDSVRSQSV